MKIRNWAILIIFWVVVVVAAIKLNMSPFRQEPNSPDGIQFRCVGGGFLDANEAEVFWSDANEICDSNDYIIKWTCGEYFNYEDYNIAFYGESSESRVVFTWKDGKFHIIYDVNNVTESAKVFLTALGPYLNEYILNKAKAILEKDKNKDAQEENI